MKYIHIIKSILLFFTALIISTLSWSQTTCCPDFYLEGDGFICPDITACSEVIGEESVIIEEAACKESFHTYTVYPNEPGYTYEWSITGGNPSSYTGNPCIIHWGSGTRGTITVIISGMGCNDSIFKKVCLIDRPEASFQVQPGLTQCIDGIFQFTNTSTGASDYFWDFGDGSFSIDTDPTHRYATAGTYTVILTAEDRSHTTTDGDLTFPCGCKDTMQIRVSVINGVAPEIQHVCLCGDSMIECREGTLCPGDTSLLYTPTNCPSYSWSVTNGSIIKGQGTECIAVKWSDTYSTPATASLTDCNSGNCPSSVTINIPVLYNGISISGKSIACQNIPVTFALPSLPGTKYEWSVSSPGSFSILPPSQDKNDENFVVSFDQCGKYTISCAYSNALSGCTGKSFFEIFIKPHLIILGQNELCVGTQSYYFTINSCQISNINNAIWEVIPPGAGNIQSSPSDQVIIEWLLPGSHTVKATALANNEFCDPATDFTVVIHPKPIIIEIKGKEQKLCPNRYFTYSAISDTPNGNFSWFVTGGQIISKMGAYNDSVVVEWDNSTTCEIAVEQQSDFGCLSDRLSKQVHIVAPPVVTGNDVVCSDSQEIYEIPQNCQSVDVDWYITDNSGNSTNIGTIMSGQGTQTVSIFWNWDSNITMPVWLHAQTCNGDDSKAITIKQSPPKPFIAPYSIAFCESTVATHTISCQNPGYSGPFQWYHQFQGVTLAAHGISPPTISNLTIDVSTLPIGTHEFFLEYGNDCKIRSNPAYIIISNCGGTSPPPPSTCPITASFTIDNCTGDNIQNNSTSSDPIYPITGYEWEVNPVGHSGTCSFQSPISSNPGILTVSQTGDYIIILTAHSNLCDGKAAQIISVFMPPIMNYPSQICAGKPASCSSSYYNPNYGYSWDFGDNITSHFPSLEHAWRFPGLYQVQFEVTNGGCTEQAVFDVTVNPIDDCIINADPNTICPGDSTLIAGCPGLSNYEWFKDSVLLGISATDVWAKSNGYYYVSFSNSFGCQNTSSETYIYLNQPPIAEIIGEKYHCVHPWTNPYTFNLETHFDANYTYNWSIVSLIPTGCQLITTTSNPEIVTVEIPVSTININMELQIVVEVTDSNTGCSSTDTACVILNKIPEVNVNYISGCEGDIYTFEVTNPPLNLSYIWSNDIPGASMATAQAGPYLVTATDNLTGCNATILAGEIFELPDLSLFPTGCDTICIAEVLELFLPLPNSMLYSSIEWYDNNNYSTSIGSGATVPFSSTTIGDHHLSVIVTTNNYCTDTAGVHCIHVKKCDCTCDSSYWEKWPTLLWYVPTGAGINNVQTITKQLPCNSNNTVSLNCRETYTIKAKYMCSDPMCEDTQMHIVLPDNSIINQNFGEVTFTADLTGYYHFVAYGYCGNTICDSCTATFHVKECPPIDCCEDKQIFVDPQVESIKKSPNHWYATIHDNIKVDYALVKNIRISIVHLDINDFNYDDCQRCQIDESKAGIFDKSSVPAIGSLQANASIPQGNREILWGNGMLDMQNGIPASYKIILPAPYDIDCCEADYKVCIKYVITDINCGVCDTTICIDISPVPTIGECNCQNNTITYNGKPINNGQTIIIDNPTPINDTTAFYNQGQTRSLKEEKGFFAQINSTCICIPVDECECYVKWTITRTSEDIKPIISYGNKLLYDFKIRGLYTVECTINCIENSRYKSNKCTTIFYIKVKR